MSATREQIYAALQAADKAGNVEDAKALAKQYTDTPETSASAPVAKKPSVLGFIGNLGMDAANAVHNTEKQFGPDGLVAQTVMHPVKAFDAAKDAYHGAADILGGAVQHVRDMSPEAQQGTAAKMDTAAFDAQLAAAKDKYGTTGKVAKAAYEHPLAPVIAGGSVVDPALRLAGIDGGLPGAVGAAANAAKSGVGKVTDTVVPAARKVVEPLKVLTTAERTGTGAANVMHVETRSALQDAQAASEADAAAQAARATRAQALAAKAKTQGRTLNDRSAAAAAESTPPAPAVGDAAHLSDIGDSVRTPAIANEDAINTEMRAADEKLRGTMQQISAEQEAKGVGVSDVPLAKAMVRQSKSIVDPDPVKRPSVGMVPADSAGAKLHTELLNVLQPRQVALTEAQAAKVAATGEKVQTAKDGTLFRVVKPSLENVEEFRRKVGQILNGQVEGYPAINQAQAREMYGNLNKVIDKYVKGASAPVQANWRAGKQALAPFEKVRAGKTLVGTQPGTDALATSSAQIPGRLISGGRDTLNQAATVAGEAPVRAAVRSQVQNALSTAKSADAAEAMVRPGSTLGNAMSTDDELTAAVRSHIDAVRQAETQGQASTDLARRSATAMSRSSRLADAAAKALQGGEKATVAARGYQQELSELEATAPKDVAPKYMNTLKRAHSDGTITTEQFNRGIELAGRAEKAFKIKSERDKWLKGAAGVLGVSALGKAGFSVLHAAGN